MGISRMPRSRPVARPARGLHLAICSALLVCLAVAERANAQERSFAYQEALNLYRRARFDEAIGMLEPRLEAGTIAQDEKADVLELLALCYVKKRDLANGKEMFARNLRDDPTWSPDPVLMFPEATDLYLQAVAEEKARSPDPFRLPVPEPDTSAVAQPGDNPADPSEPAGKPFYKKGLGLAGNLIAGLVVAGGVAFLLSKGGGDDGDGVVIPPPEGLPPFPRPPSEMILLRW